MVQSSPEAAHIRYIYKIQIREGIMKVRGIQSDETSEYSRTTNHEMGDENEIETKASIL